MNAQEEAKHIARMLGAVAGMDKQLMERGADPAQLRAEFWQRFGLWKSPTRLDPYFPNGFRYDTLEERNWIQEGCGSCGGVDRFQYEITLEMSNTRFQMHTFVWRRFTYNGYFSFDAVEEEYELESSKDMNMVEFVKSHGALVTDLAEHFGWTSVIAACRK